MTRLPWGWMGLEYMVEAGRCYLPMAPAAQRGLGPGWTSMQMHPCICLRA